MRRWNDRPATPAQFDLNRIRQIGEWGHASRHVGSRWESVGLDLLRLRVADRAPIGLLAICDDDSLAGALASTGSKNPDVILALATEDTIVLEPADLKWSLDVADYRQISAPILAGLLAQVPRFCDAIREILPEEQRAWAWVPRDGFFFCPKSVANERFLTSPENARQEYPIDLNEARLQEVEPFDFFDPLPGWSTARELARLDGATRGLPYLDNADRYYHLGCGVAGAIASIERSVFDDEVEVDSASEIDRFRSYVKTLGPPSTGLIIERLGGIMRVRQTALRDLRDLTRGAVTFRDFSAEVIVSGGAPPGEIEATIRRSWGDAYRTLMDGIDRDIRAAGRVLRDKGATDSEAIDSLKGQRDALARRWRARARTSIREMVLNGVGTA